MYHKSLWTRIFNLKGRAQYKLMLPNLIAPRPKFLDSELSWIRQKGGIAKHETSMVFSNHKYENRKVNSDMNLLTSFYGRKGIDSKGSTTVVTLLDFLVKLLEKKSKQLLWRLMIPSLSLRVVSIDVEVYQWSSWFLSRGMTFRKWKSLWDGSPLVVLVTRRYYSWSRQQKQHKQQRYEQQEVNVSSPWAELDWNVLGEIVSKLCVTDQARFCVVCKNWLAAPHPFINSNAAIKSSLPWHGCEYPGSCSEFQLYDPLSSSPNHLASRHIIDWSQLDNPISKISTVPLFEENWFTSDLHLHFLCGNISVYVYASGGRIVLDSS
ncbi:hypothetical protein POM88_002417 [Heracleum sosnowskyi]|uniref:F-box domain-containing protein n=1 Tax=Heracleum sosnowskyi TaxID=360622 RepID=A0AAD8NBA5_9APIA|nr:hypothetical protein POM88_002417 [Heracleum sosnowskyi]